MSRKITLMSMIAVALAGVATLALVTQTESTPKAGLPVPAQDAPQSATAVPVADGVRSNPATSPTSAEASPRAGSAVASPPATLPASAGDAVVSEILTQVLDRTKVPALSAVVVQGGKVVGQATVGVRKKGDPTPAERGDPFHLGTCSKAITATLIGELVEEGKLRWDSTILEVLGTEVPEIHPVLMGVTVDQLLHHRGGLLPRGPAAVWQAAQFAKGSDVEQRNAYVEAMLAMEPAKKPGEYQYSNVGYAVLGKMAEVAGGQPYEDLVRARVFAPLGITTAVFGPAGSKDDVSAPWPHLSGTPTWGDNPACLNSSARISMSLEDWAKFANLHLGHQPTPPLLSPETMAILHTLAGNVRDDQMGYACGWFRPLRPWARGRTLHHTGGNLLTFACIWLLPERDLGVLVATNEGAPVAGDATDMAAASLLSHFLGEPAEPLDSARPREKNWPTAAPKP
jgi:CubicO group peptidase (beta-lactamase class C family)